MIITILAVDKSCVVVEGEASISNEYIITRGSHRRGEGIGSLLHGVGTEEGPLTCTLSNVVETVVHVAASSQVVGYRRVFDLEYGP